MTSLDEQLDAFADEEQASEYPANAIVYADSYRRSGVIAELFAALCKAQGELEPVEKAGKNPAFRSSYATLGSVVEATREALAKNGLTCMQMPVNIGGNIGVTTLLGHSSGQWIESTLCVAPQKFDAQGVGSVITYLRRYGRMAILGLAPEDDDGQAAVGKPVPPTRHVGAFSKDQPPPAPVPPQQLTVPGNGQQRPTNVGEVSQQQPTTRSANSVPIRKAVKPVPSHISPPADVSLERDHSAEIQRLAELEAAKGSDALLAWYTKLGPADRLAIRRPDENGSVDWLKALAKNADDLHRDDAR